MQHADLQGRVGQALRVSGRAASMAPIVRSRAGAGDRGSGWAAMGRRRSLASAIGVVLTLVASYLVLPVSPAAAAPGITLTKSAPGTVRAGAPITYRLTAANPASNPDAVNEWNLSFRDVLPPGLTYVPGSTTPARAGEPTASTDAGGSTTLVWSNVADIQVASTFELAFQATPDPAVYPVGSTVPNAAQAYTNSDPLVSPEFDDSGVLVPDTATESAADDATTLVSALEITKSEPSPEGELLRGVHDHTTVYELTVRASEVGGTAGVVVTDYLPAQLEFLGCGGDDFSAGPEYPGAPPLSDTPAVPGCVEPDSVTTVTAAGTTLPPGIYTRLVWTLGALDADEVVTLPYAAGIPLRANALFPAGTAPDPESGEQGSNLDNNTGASTREGAERAVGHQPRLGDRRLPGPGRPGGRHRRQRLDDRDGLDRGPADAQVRDPGHVPGGWHRPLRRGHRRERVRVGLEHHRHRRRARRSLPARWPRHELRARAHPPPVRARRPRRRRRRSTR